MKWNNRQKISVGATRICGTSMMPVLSDSHLEEYSCGGHGGVSTQLHLSGRREPAESEGVRRAELLAVSDRRHKGRLRVVHLSGHTLQEGVRRGGGVLQQTHGGRGYRRTAPTWRRSPWTAPAGGPPWRPRRRRRRRQPAEIPGGGDGSRLKYRQGRGSRWGRRLPMVGMVMTALWRERRCEITLYIARLVMLRVIRFHLLLRSTQCRLWVCCMLFRLVVHHPPASPHFILSLSNWSN